MNQSAPKPIDLDTTELVSTRVSEAVQVMKAMSNETRLKILCSLMDGEKSVNQLAEFTDMLLPAVSQHLAKLRASGLVESRRDAQTVYYRAADGVGFVLVDALCNYYKPKTD